MEVGVKRSYTIKNRYNSIAIQWTVFSVSCTAQIDLNVMKAKFKMRKERF